MSSTAADIAMSIEENAALLREAHSNELKEARRDAVCTMLRELNDMLKSVEGNTAEFKLLAIQEFVGSYSMATQCPVTMPMYAQPSEYERWLQSGYNLLTLSRNGHFPFTRKVEVRF